MFSHDGLAEIRVARWSTERPLLILNALVSAGVWFLLFTIQVPKAPLVPRHDVVPAMDGEAKEDRT